MAYDHFKTVNYTGGNNPNGDNYTWSHTANWVTVSQVGTTDEWKFAVSDNQSGNTRNATFTVTHWLSTQSQDISASFQITQYADSGIVATTLATNATTAATNATTAATNATTAATEQTTVEVLATTTQANAIYFDSQGTPLVVNPLGESKIIDFQVDPSSAAAHYAGGGTSQNMYTYNSGTVGIGPGTIHWVDGSGNAIAEPSWVIGLPNPSNNPAVDVQGDGTVTLSFDAWVTASTTVPPTMPSLTTQQISQGK